VQTYKWSALRSALTGSEFSAAQTLRREVDLFHATDHHIPKLKDIPVVATIMDAIPLSHPEWGSPNLRWLKNKLWQKSAQWADHVITISEFSKAEIVKHFGIPAERISVVHLGVDKKYSQAIESTQIQKTQKKFNLQRPYFLCIGTLQPRKNMASAWTAYKQLPLNIQSEYDLVIVGRNGWGVETLVAQLKNQNADSHVKWLGPVAEIDKLALLQGAKALVFPSLSEGFGLPMLEAFAAGTPVIASNTTSLAEVSGGAALGIDPLNTGDIMEAMLEVSQNETLRLQMIQKGHQRSLEFTWEKCAKQTSAVYKLLA
jgi:alpha-1,3-rhamnosyl/mannosyltransferase